MPNFRSFRLAALAGLTLAILPVQGADHDSALIDALIKKGVLTTKEADAIRADMDKEETAGSASKIKLSDSITELKLYGDLRLRYQYDNRDLQLDPAVPGGRILHDNQRSRARFRLRLGTEVSLGKNWFGGAELATSQNSDSSNQTFEDGFNKYNIYISKAYLGWRNDWLNLQIGKTSNPFYTTDLVWDPDINPAGVFEQVAFHKLFASTTTTEGGYAKDGKTAIPGSTVTSAPPWELTLIAGQMFYDDNMESGSSAFPFDNDRQTDVYLFQTQLLAAYKFGNGVKATFAPAWQIFNAGSVGGLVNENSFQDTVDNIGVSGSSRNLNLLLAPGDISFNLGSLKTKLYWDFSYNIEGRKRAENTYGLIRTEVNPDGSTKVIKEHRSEDDFAYLVGLQFGENKKAGDLSFLANWRQTGIASVDPNQNEGDYALGELNTRGFKFSLGYNPTDFTVLQISYMYAWNIRKGLVGGEATGDQAVADGNNIQVFQVDFSLKF